jgi:hypothetical protein
MSLLLNNKRRRSTGGGGSDPYANNVVLFLKGDGANGSTNIVDSSPTPKTVSIFGNTQISTAQSKYGNSSILFDGIGDYLTIPSGDIVLNSDFTIELWSYIYGINLNSYDNFALASSVSICLRYPDGGFGNKLQFSYSSGSFASIYSCSFTKTNNQDVWRHLAWTRQSGINKLFVNGVQQNLGTGANPSSYPLTSFSNSTTIQGIFTIGNQLKAYVDTYRITTVARYTSNFNPETDTYLNV